MNDFLQALPWRLAALAGLVIGIVSFIGAQVDFWFGVGRVAAAFALFFVIGSVARTLLIVATPENSPREGSSPASAASERTERA